MEYDGDQNEVRRRIQANALVFYLQSRGFQIDA
jgi:hypothetical protein